jgi:hypothetical protein
VLTGPGKKERQRLILNLARRESIPETPTSGAPGPKAERSGYKILNNTSTEDEKKREAFFFSMLSHF